MIVPCLLTIDDLADPAALEQIVGPIAAVERTPLPAAGLSGSSHERITVLHPDGFSRHLLLKTVAPAQSWTAYRSGDRVGREAQVLVEPALQGIWDCVACSYLACAIEPEQIGLLMDDLSSWLLPPGRRLSAAQEDAFLRTLATLHAGFWQSNALALPWLAPLPVRFSILGPGAGEEELRRRPEHPLFQAVARGWEIALARAPSSIRDLLLLSAEEIAADHAGLPSTLLHGDAKTGNAAYLLGGRVALFDWATTGPGPATLDLYYFLAVDVSRHASVRETIIARYRQHLEAALGHRLGDTLWLQLERVGMLAAARMLLWSKALALESDAPEAESDWRWWIEQLERRDHHL